MTAATLLRPAPAPARMGDIGEPVRRIEVIPVPEPSEAPVKEPSPAPAPAKEPEKVPA